MIEYYKSLNPKDVSWLMYIEKNNQKPAEQVSRNHIHVDLYEKICAHCGRTFTETEAECKDFCCVACEYGY